MSILEAIILGIVQGLTEFLPVSSSGHLIMMKAFFGIEESTLLFSIVVHLGTLIPVLVVYRKEVFALIRQPFQRYTYLIILGTLPAVVAALLLGDNIEAIFNNPTFLPITFLITALLLIYADSRPEGRKRKKDITYKDALLIGCMQAVAILPGLSRSGSTITVGITRGLNRDTAARYSFMLSIPAILGGLVLEVAGIVRSDTPEIAIGALPLFVGFVSAMLTGFIAISLLLELIKRRNLRVFSYYLIALSAVLIVINIIF
ncbi:MAG: undecaprenyl-diphosphate phosphatase [Defluviitaleaceae bacterium]|nr:undecaprenyl-diphosphate phosphatase [Defluviitaleaceae bacterium]